ncbi:hypothetical protein KY347_03730 [Candidatus Woesearchaeota archaeon]|nr:hypothetical protein [Candidatus Woesearchaeota archaeon]
MVDFGALMYSTLLFLIIICPIIFLIIFVYFVFGKIIVKSEKIKKLNISWKSILIMDLGGIILFFLVNFFFWGEGSPPLNFILGILIGILFINILSFVIEVILKLLLRKKIISERTANIIAPFIISGFIFSISIFFYYFSLLEIEHYSPEPCVMEPGIACVNYKIEPTQAMILLSNGLGRTIMVKSINISGCCAGLAGCTPENLSISIRSGDDYLFTATGCSNGARKDTFKGPIILKYTEIATGKQKTNNGDITTKIE